MTPNPKRTKHAALVRPDTGEFGRYELAILGAPCGDIQALVARLLPLLSPELRVAYVDADHASGDADEAPQPVRPGGLSAELVDKIHYRQLNTLRPLDKFSQPELLAHESLVLVNGNHFRARQQIVIIDPRKPLDKKLDRLSDVQLILLAEGETELPTVLQSHLAGATPPVLSLADTAGIAAFISQWYAAAVPPLRGLVLAGGRSERMQTDKGSLRYHGTDQRQHTAALLAEFCTEVHVSCRPEQAAELQAAGLQPLPDTFLGLGPLGGLLSAFQADPNAAWLVLACDLPYLTRETLQFLVENRQPGRAATAFQSPWNDFPEPLITIWEPRSYGQLLRFLSLGYSCPRKALINSDTAIIQPPVPGDLRNVNTPEERAEAENELGVLE
jgi:molybdopterin-guanine dinucleotide biosynthesis protein A